MFDRTRQAAAMFQKIEDRLVAEQKAVMEDWKKKAQAAVDRVNTLCDRLEEQYPDLKDKEE